MSDEKPKRVPRVKFDLGDPSGVMRAIARQTAIADAFAPVFKQMAEINSLNIAGILTPDFYKALGAQQSLISRSVQINGQFDNLPQMNRILSVDLQTFNALAGQIQSIVLPLNNAIMEAINRSMTTIDFAGIQELLARRMPPNWPRRLKMEVAQRLVNEFGLPLVWVPGPAVVTLLAEAPDAEARRAVLVDNAGAIIADVRACLNDLRGFGEVEDHVTLLRKAAAAVADGHVEAGQALATDVLDALVLVNVGKHAQVAKTVKPLADDTVFAQLIYAAALSPLVLAYQPFWADKGDPVPVIYNRHATVHAGNGVQFSHENALIALMLATSIARTVRYAAEQETQDAA